MPIFEYKARAKDGSLRRGVVEADTESLAADILSDRDLLVVSMEAQRREAGMLRSLENLLNRVTKKDLAVLLRQLSILISASIPLVQALKMLVEQTEKKVIKEALLDIANAVETGTRFSEALSRYPNIFNDFFVNMVKSGETSGKLDDILLYLADQQERDYELESKIRGAMVYPAFIVCALMAVGVVMMVWVLPNLLTLFEEFDAATLPWQTRVLIATTSFSQSYWYIILAVVVAAVAGVRWYARTPGGRFMWGQLKLRIPVFSTLFRYVYTVRFSRSFGTVLVGGVTVTEGLAVVREVVGNPVFEKVLSETISEVEEGNSLVTVMEQTEVFPAMVPQMLSVGEQTGRLDDVLSKITTFYTREINAQIDNIVALIEPVIMILLGVAVFIVVGAVLLPMYDLASQF